MCRYGLHRKANSSILSNHESFPEASSAQHFFLEESKVLVVPSMGRNLFVPDGKLQPKVARALAPCSMPDLW